MKKTSIGNLSMYQRITTYAKKVGGPQNLLTLVAVGGATVALTVKFAIEKALTKNRIENTDRPIYTVTSTGKDEQGLKFKSGDKYCVWAVDGDAAMIEKIGDKNNPYYVSLSFLRSISDFPEETDST